MQFSVRNWMAIQSGSCLNTVQCLLEAMPSIAMIDSFFKKLLHVVFYIILKRTEQKRLPWRLEKIGSNNINLVYRLLNIQNHSYGPWNELRSLDRISNIFKSHSINPRSTKLCSTAKRKRKLCFLCRNFYSTRSWATVSSSPTSCPLIVWSLSSWTRCYLTSTWVQYECDWCDGLCLNSATCQTLCENVWAGWPCAAVKRYLCFSQRQKCDRTIHHWVKVFMFHRENH